MWKGGGFAVNYNVIYNKLRKTYVLHSVVN
jgi:hypothetical protein